MFWELQEPVLGRLRRMNDGKTRDSSRGLPQIYGRRDPCPYTAASEPPVGFVRSVSLGG
jgi:hypothetical protein